MWEANKHTKPEPSKCHTSHQQGSGADRWAGDAAGITSDGLQFPGLELARSPLVAKALCRWELGALLILLKHEGHLSALKTTLPVEFQIASHPLCYLAVI